MKRTSWKRMMSVALSLLLSIQMPFCTVTPIMSAYAYTERAAKINASSLNVRSGPGTTYSQVGKLAMGTSVTVVNETTSSDGKLWYQIRFSGAGGKETAGYVLSTYIKFPASYTADSNFESYLTSEGFPESYKPGLRELHAQYPNWVFRAQHTGLDWNTVIENESIVGRNLVAASSISSWKSVAPGAYDWDTGKWPGFDGSSWVAASEDIIRYYMDPRNFLDEVYVFQFLLHSYNASSHTKEGLQTMIKGTFLEDNTTGTGNISVGTGSVDNSGGQQTGTSAGVGPGGQSSSQTGSGSSGGPGGSKTPQTSQGGSSQNGSGSSDMIDSSAPTRGNEGNVSLTAPSASISAKRAGRVATSGYGPGMNMGGSSGQSSNSSSTSPSAGGSSIAYADILMNAGNQSGVNPYVLAAMIIQEQGRNGTSDLISGTCPGYEGYYNYFNIEAYQSGSMSAVQRGLWYASQSGNYERPWNTPEKAILGGAVYYGTNYVKAGQDTFYLKKFNVQGNNLYKHQYMTHVRAAASEASLYAEAYSPELKKTALEFRIPVYKNMPNSPSARPTMDGSPNNKLGNMGVEGFALTPTFNKDVQSYNLIVDHTVSNVNVYANVLDSKATVSGSGNIQLVSGNNDIKITVTAENGTLREYVIHVVRQSNGPTYNAGIGGSTGTETNPGTGTGTEQTVSGPDSGTGPGMKVNPDGSSGAGNSSLNGDTKVEIISPAG